MQNVDRSLRVALIGYGYSGKTFHAPLISAVPGLELTLVGSRDPQKVRADLPTMNVVEEAAAAVVHPEVDLVVIASPNETHAPLAELALRSGKHVVVDKPFTVHLRQAERLAELAASEGRLLSVFHNRRWDSDFLALRELLSAGKLGEVLHFESHFDRFRPQVQNRWREDDVPGGGIWYDLGPHLIDQALVLFGRPQGVAAGLVRQRPGSRNTDWAHVRLDYGARQVILHASMLVAGGVPRFTVHGTAGSWTKEGLDTQEAALRVGGQPGQVGWGVDDALGTFHDGKTGETSRTTAPAGCYQEFYRQVRAAVVDGAPNPVPPAQAVAVMQVLEAAVESAAQGETLTLAQEAGTTLTHSIVG